MGPALPLCRNRQPCVELNGIRSQGSGPKGRKGSMGPRKSIFEKIAPARNNDPDWQTWGQVAPNGFKWAPMGLPLVPP